MCYIILIVRSVIAKNTKWCGVAQYGAVWLNNGAAWLNYGAAWLNMVRRGSIGSAWACCKAGPSSILGSAPQGGFSHWADKRWRDGEKPQRMMTDKCDWMNVRGVLGNKCSGQHNLKTIHFKALIVYDNFLPWSSAICVFFCSALSTTGQRGRALL